MKKMFLFFPFDSNFIVHGPLGLAEGGGKRNSLPGLPDGEHIEEEDLLARCSY